MSKTGLKETLTLLTEATRVRVQQSSLVSNNKSQGIYCFIPLSTLSPGKFQPRRHFKKNTLQELAASIASDGVLQPLIVRSVAKDRYEIIAGERRWRASKLAGLEEVPVIIRQVSDACALAFGILENLQRDDLNPIDEADAYKRLIEEFSLTHEEVSKRVGKSRSVITNSLRLLKLPDEIKNALIEGKIQVGHAKSIHSLSGDMMIDIFHEICIKELSVRETEKLVRRSSERNASQINNQYKNTDRIRKLESELSSLYGLPVIIKCDKYGEGRAVISFDSLEEIEKIVACGSVVKRL